MEEIIQEWRLINSIKAEEKYIYACPDLNLNFLDYLFI